MHWPDIFFKARKPRPDSELPSPIQPAPKTPKPASAELQAPAVKSLPVASGPQAAMASEPLKTEPVKTETRTLPATHGVVLRPPARLAVPAAPLKNIEQLMAEADPLHTLRQTGNLRILKPAAPESAPPKAPTETPAEPAPMKSEPISSSAASPSTPPPFRPAADHLPLEVKKADPAPQAPASSPISTGAPKPDDEDSPFILTPAASSATTPARSLMPFGSIFRRKAKMTELARIVLPPKREESQPLPAFPESSPTVVPPAFPVAGAAHGGAAHGGKPEISLASLPPSAGLPRIHPDEAKPTGTETTTPVPAPIPLAGENPSAPVPDLFDAPKVDPEAHKPEPSATPLPKVDPEAHKPAPAPAAPIPSVEPGAPSVAPEKREFHLANGEHVVGVVLSETPEAVYIEHGTLGVLTIPRANIAKRLVEIILINGDRIVGDIMAETADTLYVRHSSLGMLTVPRAQRSTRVVEAILKDGDRILGEVLTETDTFTVIRSATLGTITVPHGKMAMLNRKIEQIEMKSLPPPAPELKDKSSLL
jgi:RNase P/RNase MRP subunit p29